MNKKLLIVGAGGHGKVAADIAVKMKKWEEIIFLDDNNTIKNCVGFPVVGRLSDIGNYILYMDIFIAIGNNEIREKIQNKLEEQGASIVVLIHPEAIIGMEVEIGAGSIVMAGAVINSASRIGKGCIVNTASVIEHDNYIEDYVHISPGARLAGNVRIGKRSWIGVGSTVSNHVTVCSGCQTGAGAVVIKNIEKAGIYIGVPVKLLGKVVGDLK